MNKTKKIAIAAVSLVMAGAMVVPLAACGGGPKYVSDPTLDENGKLTYAEGTEVNVNIMDSANVDRKISYDVSQIYTEWKGLDGVTVKGGDLKPAWRQFGKTLGITFKDTAKGGRSGKELGKAIEEGDIAQHNLINASSAEIMGNMGELLDINQYLKYMPNYAAFLKQNPIVQWSLTMNTSNGAMYYIPYFDGNDDIEKYELVQRNWVRQVLDDATPIAGTTTFKAQAVAKGLTGTATAVEAFMGQTGNWVVETSNPEYTAESGDTVKETIFVKCDYDKALADAKNTATGLGAAINEAAGETYNGTSGNIVDLQNFAINKKGGGVTGAQLAKILREYIKVAYYKGATADEAKSSNTAMYTATNLADVFNSTSAAWDADLMTAMFRCVVTNYDQFFDMSKYTSPEYVWALAGREMKAQRENDLIALAGELYGVRGMESRLEYTYINSSGMLADARTNQKSYEAAEKLNKLAQEGLLFNQVDENSKTINKVPKAETNMTFMIHDYAQTQTTDGFKKTDSDEFDFAPILTPVSKWDTNDDGTAETTMRFTESWRSVKNSGVCIPKASITSGDKLSAVLTFIDYLYSNDGQIIGSYGTQASGKTEDDGYWYGNPVTGTIGGVTVTNGVGDLEALKNAGVVATNDDGVQYYIANTEANKANRAKYFMYGNKIYEGKAYKDRNVPIMTDNNLNFFLGNEVTGSGKMYAVKTKPEEQTDKDKNYRGYGKDHATKYTDYARGVVGAALPIGNKDQGFEYQCTANCALDGSDVVAYAINNGTIKHVVQTIDTSKWWYTEAPTVLPVSISEANAIKKQQYLDGDGKSLAGMFNATSTAGVSNVYIDLAFWGYGEYLIGTNHKTSSNIGSYAMQTNAADLLNYIKSYDTNGLQTRLTYYGTAWVGLKTLNNY